MEATHPPEVSYGDEVTTHSVNNATNPLPGARSHDDVMKECERRHKEATNAMEEALKGGRDPALFEGTYEEYDAWRQTREELDKAKVMRAVASNAKREAKKVEVIAADELFEKRKALKGIKEDALVKLLTETGHYPREREASEALNARSMTLEVADKVVNVREAAHAKADEMLAEFQRKIHRSGNAEGISDVRLHKHIMKECELMHEEATNMLDEVEVGELLLRGKYGTHEWWKQTREKLNKAEDVRTRVVSAKRKAEEIDNRVNAELTKKRKALGGALGSKVVTGLCTGEYAKRASTSRVVTSLFKTAMVANKAVKLQMEVHSKANDTLMDFQRKLRGVSSETVSRA